MKNRFKFTQRDLKDFKSNGYLVCRNFISEKDVVKILKWTSEIERFKDVKGKWMKYFDPSLINKKKQILARVENFYDYHRNFRNFFSKKKILDELAKLVGGKVCLFKDKINFKYCGSKGFEAHQDATIWKGMYGIKNFLTMSITIDRSTLKNGCLEIVKNPKKNKLLSKWEKIPKNIENKLKWLPIETNPGDIIFFHDYTPHRSADNFSSNKRRMIFLTYNKKIYGDHRLEHFADKRRNFPPNIEREKGKKYIFHI